ncbi:MAG: hypothetical protein U9N84_07415 [Actinomycetota bacterium]|nr:hypothetical protein [Actinomycetota bacterium]
MSIRRLSTDEEGTTIVLVAMVLVVLMGFAAIAIDGAAAWALRRQDQSGADTGAIAAALFTADRTKAQAMQDAENEVIRITYSTMTPDMTAGEWAAEWAACTDPSKPAEFTETLGSDCISFSSNLDQIRVQTPVIPWKTTFAQAIGFNQIDTSASAEVSLDMSANGGVLPFGMPGDASDVNEICLKTGPNPSGVPPCDGPATGNFGFLNFTQFGNDALGTSQDCNPDTGTLTEAIAHGIDHPMGKATVFPAPPHEDRVACNDGNFNSRPYQVFTNTGNVAQALDDGFAGDGAGLDGKLGTGSNLIDVRGKALDNTPLWDYLTPSGKLFCAPIASPITTHDEMVACLALYKSSGSTAELFTPSIIAAPRWGWVPLFHEATLGNGTTPLTIKDFRAVYIQTTLMSCIATTCEVIWDPGEPATHPGPGKTNIRIEAATAIQLPASSLPEIARLSEPGSDTQVDYLLAR